MSEVSPFDPRRAGADRALKSAFPEGLTRPLAQGARGTGVYAVQYALGRLGHLPSLVDGAYGPKTARAVSEFQRSRALRETGVVDALTLGALDDALRGWNPTPPAARARDPIGYLSDFAALGLARMTVNDRARPVDWNHPEVQTAYGEFVTAYWPVCKANRVEADCKTLALFFMDQFRARVRGDLGVSLPSPASREGSLRDARWVAITAARPLDFFRRFESLPETRPGYSSAKEIQRLDPTHSMIYGVNVRRSGASAHAVARAATVVTEWNVARDNRGDRGVPEVPVGELRAGHVIFIDHRGEGRWDHTVNVVSVTRDGTGRARSLVLAVGSFDHMLDADSETEPTSMSEVNNYSEEVTVDLDENGRIAGSRVSWSSEPVWLVAPRYSAVTTLMELGRGGRLRVSRWG